MSLYSQMIGSFIRTGDYPMEANYIFPSEAALKEFYSDPTNATLLHKGLLKLVEDGGTGKLALYWVERIDGNLEFTKLIEANNISEINSMLDVLDKKINLEISDRELSDLNIQGIDDLSALPEDLNSIKDLSEAIENLREFLSNIDKTLLAVVGTDENIIEYLKTLPYQSLTEVSEALNKFLNTIDEENTSINTLPELIEFLRGFEYTHNLYECFYDLWNKIEGTPTPNTLFRTLRGILDFVQALATATQHRDDNILEELNNTQEGVGLDGNGSYSPDRETYYLKSATSVMNALKILDSLINLAINNCNLVVTNSNTVELTLIKQAEETSLKADVIVSTESGNGIIKKNDGIYYKLNTTYNNGELTIYVNDNVISQHNLGLSFVGINQAYYDTATEEIVLIFNKEDGTTDTLRLPVTNLIREWVIDNSGPSNVVVLTREEVYGNGADKLSADVRLYDDKYNILKKEGNTLYVKGTADNIVYNDVTVSSIIEDLQLEAVHQTEDISNLRLDLDNEVNRAKLAEVVNSNAISQELTRAEAAESNLGTRINTLENTTSDLSGKLDDEISRATLKDADLLTAINTETTRATTAESSLSSRISAIENTVGDNISVILDKLDAEILRSTENDTQFAIDIATINNELKDKLEEVKLILVNDLLYKLLVDGNECGIINIPKDLFLKSVELVDSSLKFTFDTKDGITYTEINLSDVILQSLISINLALTEEINRALLAEHDLESKLDTLTDKVSTNTDNISNLNSELNSEILRAKDAETLLQLSVIKELNRAKLAEVQLSLLIENIRSSSGNTLEDLSDHIHDYDNPHRVTKELIGLGNVDNTSDLNKPISNAVQNALDNKADLTHTHSMSDIADLELLPIVEGFVQNLTELPDSASEGDKFILYTLVGGNTRYVLVEFEGGNWKLKLLTVGGIACVVDGELWKLNSNGIERVLDAADYNYFYNMIWNETKNLVQSIEWEKTPQSGNQIRLKITTKKSYSAPNTNEAVQPTIVPEVTYIDIEKERFMSSAYSRPATQLDVDNGYASSVGVPVLVIELTTGNEVVIDLTDTMNIYDPKNTSSISTTVTNWSGNVNDSYKISSKLNIAENNDSVKIVDNGTTGVYARLDKKNTKSIQLNDDGNLSADLILSATNNIESIADVILTIHEDGLAAKLQWGEYD